MPNLSDLPSERLKRTSAQNASVFGPALSAFQGQLHPAVANVFGVGQQAPQPAPSPGVASTAAFSQPATPASAAPQGSLIEEEVIPPFMFDESNEIPAEELKDDAPDGTFMFDASNEFDPSLADEFDEIQARSDEDLVNDLFFIPEKYIAEKWDSGSVYSAELEDRMISISAQKDAKGYNLSDLKAIVKRAAGQSPQIVMDAFMGAGQLGKNIWIQAKGDTIAEKAAASQKLLASVELGGVESGGLLMNLVPPLKGVAEASATAATGGGFKESVVRGLGTTARGFLGPMGPIIPDVIEEKLDKAVDRFDPRDPAEEFRNRAGKYYEYARARRGEGVVAETLGLSGDEMEQLGIVLDPEEIDNMSILTDVSNFVPVAAGSKGWKLMNKTTGKAVAQSATLAGLEKVRNRIVNSISKSVSKVGPAISEGARSKVAGAVKTTGKAIKDSGGYLQKKVGGIAVASGLVATMYQGRPDYLVMALGVVLGAQVMKGLGKKLKDAGVKFGKGEGLAEFMRKRASTATKGAVAGYAGAVPLAMLADDPEMAAGILGSGALGSYGALGSEAKAGARNALLTNLHQAWNQADVNAVPSAPYEMVGERADDIGGLNQGHQNALRKMGSNPVGQKAAALISRIRETFRTVVNPETGQAQQTRIWVTPKEEFKQRFGADAHGYFAGTSPDGAYEIFLSEDTTGAHHEVGHLMDALLTNEQRLNMQRSVEKAFGDEKIEGFRKLYELMLNAGVERGQPAIQISREHAIAEIIAEHNSLISRGNPLTGLPQEVAGQAREYVGGILQRVFPGLQPRVGAEAATIAGTLPIEPSFQVIQAAREAAKASGLPTAPVEVVLTEPGTQAPPAPPTPPSAPAAPVPGDLGTAPVAPGAPTEAAPGFAEAPVTPAAPLTPKLPGVTPRIGNLPAVTGEPPENLRGPDTRRLAEGSKDVKDLNDVESVLREVEADPGFSEDHKQVLRSIAQAIRETGTDSGGPLVSLFYNSVRPEAGKASQRRWARRNEQAEAYYQEMIGGDTVKAETRKIFQKNIVPYRFQRVGPEGKQKVHILGLSPDKVLGNATILLNDLAGSNSAALQSALEWLPPSWEYTQTPGGFRFTAKGLDAMAADLAVYSNNHANGFTGAGQSITVPEGYQRFVPEAAPGFTPSPLPASTATALNVLMGLAPPTTTIQRGAGAGRNPATGQKITIPANVEAQILATENGLTPVQSLGAKFTKKEAKAKGLAGVTVQEAGTAPQFTVPELGGQTFPIMEVNPMRQQLAAAGYDAKQNLTEAIERLNLEDIVVNPEAPTGGIDVQATPLAEISTPLATAGFLPRAEAYKRLFGPSKLTPDQYAAWARSVDGGITGEAYRLAVSLSPQDKESASSLSSALQKKTKVEVQQLLVSDPMEGMKVSTLPQFYRELNEAIDDKASMEGFGSKKGLQFPDILMLHPKVQTTIDGMKSGEKFGETINADGTTFDPSKFTEWDDTLKELVQEKLDGVTMMSVNVPLSELTKSRVQAEMKPFIDAFGSERVKAGMFKLSKPGPRGEAMVSLDINALVNQRHRDNSMAFAAANNQEAIWDFVKSEAVPTGGDGNTVVSDATSVKGIAKAIVDGKMPDFPAAKGSDLIGGQYLPSKLTNLETIQAAAVRSPKTGGVWTGPMHFVALQKATQELGIGPQQISEFFPDASVDQGFVTSKGRFVSREDAFRLAERANQIPEAGRQELVERARSSEPRLVSEETAGLGTNPERTLAANEQFLPRTKPDPEKTVTAYKLFRAKEGKLYPLFVEANQEIPVGEWQDAVVGTAGTRPGKVKSRLGDLTNRPGWHAGDLPVATHIGVKDANGNVASRRANEVWAEVEVSADKSYQGEADANGTNPTTGKFNPGGADLKTLPADGYYRFKTNPNMTGNWLIAGSMKINRVLPEAEVNQVLADAGVASMPWEGGALDLESLGFLPRKRKEPKINLAKRPAAWILPNGETRAVETGRHENDLAENAAEYNKRFGTTFGPKVDEIKGREAALRAGFTRVRFDSSNRMNVEVPVAKWPSARKQVEKIFLDNEDDVNSVRVSVVDTAPKTPKVLDFTTADFLSMSQNPFGDVTVALDTLRTRGQSFSAFLPKDASIAAKRRAAKEEIQAAAAKWPEQQPLQIKRDGNNVPVQNAKGNLVYNAVPYDIANTPVAEELRQKLPRGLAPREAELRHRENVSEEIGNRLVKEYESIGDERVDLARNWYKLASTLNQRVFNGDAELFAKLIAATSPQTGVRENFIGALGAYNQLKKGNFDTMIADARVLIEKFEAKDPETLQAFAADVKKATDKASTEGDVRSAFVRWAVEKGGNKPRKSNQTLFGANSLLVAQVLLDEWNPETGGKKTHQFTKNLTGEDFGPTIDVWAARLPYRLMSEGKLDQWRIHPKNETGVTDIDYDIFANGYRKAAAKLGMDPADLQAVVWFYEKKVWTERGWTGSSGQKLASFVEFLESVRRTPEGELVIQPDPGTPVQGLDLTPAEAAEFVVPPSLANAPVETFGTKSLVEKSLAKRLNPPPQRELAL